MRLHAPARTLWLIHQIAILIAMKDVTIAAAKNQLPALVHEVEVGGAIRLTRRGKPVAVLMSLEAFESQSLRPRTFWEAVDAFREAEQPTDQELDDAFADVRDRSPGRDFKW